MWYSDENDYNVWTTSNVSFPEAICSFGTVSNARGMVALGGTTSGSEDSYNAKNVRLIAYLNMLCRTYIAIYIYNLHI